MSSEQIVKDKSPAEQIFRKDRVEIVDEALACTLWGDLLSSGVPILQCCERVGEEFPSYAEAMTKIRAYVRGGDTIYESALESGLFNGLTVEYIKLGEERGKLDITLKRAGQLIENVLAGYGISAPDELTRTTRVGQIFFYDVFSELPAEIGVSDSLDILAKYSICPPGDVIEQMSQQVAGGVTVREAMQPHPAYFSPLAVTFVSAGESGAILDQTLGLMRDHLIRKYTLGE